ncbi:sulfurtransferase [Rhodococcus erythropolis]|uniref:sulfurtransferase n=1 Tax=Rhodococcus erythropolis TaxID=1833 RepID=UPI002227744D|nr:rhodanese-like domain-containing protein [Rhodococcus erythropolis]MCW2299573.1 thiosulfate/3-mercaptopyruvate sulfurtransferase [Rhodococcus erythropolis]
MTEAGGIERRAVIVSATELRELIRSDRTLVVVNVVLDNSEGGAGIITAPQSITLSINNFQSSGGGTEGNRPLPDLDAFGRTLNDLKVPADAHIVVYSSDSPLLAARAWFTLRWAGRSVRYLDGGSSAWASSRKPISTNDSMPVPPSTASTTLADAEGALRAASAGRLLDARGSSSFRAGHIPGSISAPATDLLDDNGFLLPDRELREYFHQFGIERGGTVVSYCVGGVAASHNALALAAVGIRSAVYVASWSGWSADPERPVSTDIHHTPRNPDQR